MTPLILTDVKPGTSTIETDQWISYFGWSTVDYDRITVNHITNCVDPLTSVNTQTIELSCSRCLKIH